MKGNAWLQENGAHATVGGGVQGCIAVFRAVNLCLSACVAEFSMGDTMLSIRLNGPRKARAEGKMGHIGL